VCIGRVLLNILFIFSAVVLSLISHDCVENCATIKSDVIEIQYQYINIYTYLICNSQHTCFRTLQVDCAPATLDVICVVYVYV